MGVRLTKWGGQKSPYKSVTKSAGGKKRRPSAGIKVKRTTPKRYPVKKAKPQKLRTKRAGVRKPKKRW